MPEILEEEKIAVPLQEEEKEEQDKREACRNFLHKVAREGRGKKLRSVTLLSEDGYSRVLYDLKKILKGVSHEGGESSSSKEGRNKHLVFKPCYYLLRS